MLREGRIRVLTMSEMACRTILRRTGLLWRVLMTSVLAFPVANVVVHCSVSSFVLITAASRESWEEMEGV